MDNQITCAWQEDKKDFDAELNGHHIRMAAETISPKPLLLVALAGCTGLDIVSLLEKMHVKFDRFNMTVGGDLTKEYPKFYHHIHLTYEIHLAETDRNKMEKAVSLSVEKYCGVHAMLEKAAKVTHEIVYL